MGVSRGRGASILEALAITDVRGIVLQSKSSCRIYI
jgi:hypothetical protein